MPRTLHHAHFHPAETSDATVAILWRKPARQWLAISDVEEPVQDVRENVSRRHFDLSDMLTQQHLELLPTTGSEQYLELRVYIISRRQRPTA